MKPSIPDFGVALPGCSYELRPGGYAVLRDGTGRIAVVVTSHGCFLPGGGQEAGESPVQALRRETIELRFPLRLQGDSPNW
ncbi:MAG: NUDIX domain-containing protein [Verrucomicrobia bacterium]|nr:NUDIX domain-containing protein [Verrucomicrobiota bacterium]